MTNKQLITYIKREKRRLNKHYSDDNEFFAGYITGRIASLNLILEAIKCQ